MPVQTSVVKPKAISVQECSFTQPSRVPSFELVQTGEVTLPTLDIWERMSSIDYTFKALDENLLFVKQWRSNNPSYKQNAVYNIKSSKQVASNLNYPDSSAKEIMNNANVITYYPYKVPKYIEIKDMNSKTLFKEVLANDVTLGEVIFDKYIVIPSPNKLYLYNLENFKHYTFENLISDAKTQTLSFSASPDGEKIYVGLLQKYRINNRAKTELISVGLLDTVQNKIVPKVSTARYCNSSKFLVTEDKLVCTGKNVNIFDLEKGKLEQSFRAHGAGSQLPEYSLKNNALVSFGFNNYNQRQPELSMINLNSNSCKKLALPKLNGYMDTYIVNWMEDEKYISFSGFCGGGIARSEVCSANYLDYDTLYVKSFTDERNLITNVRKTEIKTTNKQFIKPVYSNRMHKNPVFNQYEIIKLSKNK